MKREGIVGVVVCLLAIGGCASPSTNENTSPSDGGAEAQSDAASTFDALGFGDASKSDGAALQSVTFYADTTWTCPPGVTTIFVTGTGGGGGGGGFGTGSTAGYPNGCIDPQQGGCFEGGGGGGGGAAAVSKQQVTVTPGTAYAIAIGQGGGHAPPYQVGVAGGDTTFGGSLLTLAGGGGANNVFNGAPGAAGGTGGQPGAQGGSQGGKGGDTLFGTGGGGSAVGDPGTGYGSGGGGTTWVAAGPGGDGAPGFLEIEWYEVAVSQ